MKLNDRRPLLAIVGPTAVGKTAYAIRLAEIFDGEIVSADSRQVYRGMDIGTAKSTPLEQSRVCRIICSTSSTPANPSRYRGGRHGLLARGLGLSAGQPQLLESEAPSATAPAGSVSPGILEIESSETAAVAPPAGAETTTQW